MTTNNHPETGAFVPLSSVSDSTDKSFCRNSAAVGSDVHRGIGDGGGSLNGLACRESSEAVRSKADDWRIAVHEAGHVLIHRIYGNEVSVTIVPDAECSGKTWWPEGVDAAAVWAPDCVSRDDDADGVFSVVRQGVIAIMGGCAAEMALLGSEPPKYIGSDIPNASYFARMVCSTTASVVAFNEYAYQESLALVEQHKTIVHAIAQALIDHPKQTLTSAEIDAVIVSALAAKAAADEHKRRADWRDVLTRAAELSAGLES
jgi:hypothetical protein